MYFVFDYISFVIGNIGNNLTTKYLFRCINIIKQKDLYVNTQFYSLFTFE